MDSYLDCFLTCCHLVPLIIILLRSIRIVGIIIGHSFQSFKVLHFMTISLVQFSCSIMSDSLQPHESQHSILPIHHRLPEFTQTHVHRVGNAIQPPHPLSSPSPPAPNPSQHQGFFPMSQLFASGGQSIGVSASTSVLP